MHHGGRRELADGGADNVVVQSIALHGRYYASTEIPQVSAIILV